MIGDEADLELARRRAYLARRHLLRTLTEIRDRLHPRALAGEAWEKVRDRGEEMAAGAVRSVKEKPARAAAIAGAVALFLARKPIADSVKALLVRGDADDEGGEAVERGDQG